MQGREGNYSACGKGVRSGKECEQTRSWQKLDGVQKEDIEREEKS
jgi:hypothetical protein